MLTTGTLLRHSTLADLAQTSGELAHHADLGRVDRFPGVRPLAHLRACGLHERELAPAIRTGIVDRLAHFPAIVQATWLRSLARPYRRVTYAEQAQAPRP